MGLLTLTLIRAIVRRNLDLASVTPISDTELNAIINDGYRDVCVKSLCYETKITQTNIPASIRYVPLMSSNVIRVNYVEYDLSSSCLGMQEVLPQTIGHTPADTSVPRYWFQWGDYLVIEPLPDVATYDLFIYASCLPSTDLSGDTDKPSAVPPELQDCIAIFATAFSALKLKRWAAFAYYYNKYIELVQLYKDEYITKYPEARSLQDIPNTVTIGVR